MDAKSFQRFMAKVQITPAGCWEWTGAKTDKGYGQFWNDGHNNRAHRVSYEHFVGAIPKGMELDHLCNNHACVNPHHLEPVSGEVNLLRKYMRANLSSVVGFYLVKVAAPVAA
jgi:hypothetical protein